MEMWMKIILAVIFAFFIWRMWPVANHWLKNGPKGSQSDWNTALLLLAGVVGFVILLVMVVRN